MSTRVNKIILLIQTYARGKGTFGLSRLSKSSILGSNVVKRTQCRQLSQHWNKHLLTATQVQETSFASSCKKNLAQSQQIIMPVVTTMAVAAHRHNHCPLHDLRPSQNRTNVGDKLAANGRIMPSYTGPPQVGGTKFGGCGYFSTVWNHSFPIVCSRNEARRFYSKSKDKPKGKKSVVVINEAEMAEVINVEAFKGNLEKLVEQMKEEFTKQLSIRGAAGALESLSVEFEGETYPLQELAQVGRKNPQLAVLNLSSLPDACQPVLKAIQESGMNLNPQQEGTTIYVPLPKITREHRENLSKNAKTLFNKYKSSFQSVQNKYLKQCKSQPDVSEDLLYNVQQQIMKLTESYVLEAEKLMITKQAELLENKS